MKNFLQNLKNSKIIDYILILLAATIASIPLIKLRVYGTDDGFVHILRIMGVENILKSGTFPALLDSKYCNGFGYAINVFYPPLVTYLPLLFRLFFSSYANCLKIYTYFTIIISGITMYKFVKELSDRREIALFSTIIYIFLPYRLETIYNRFAIGEFSAYMFIPLVFLGLHNSLYGDKKKHFYITIGAVGLMLTHTLSTEYTAIFVLIYLLLNASKMKDKEVIKNIIINLIFIIIISAFFLIPLLEYKIHSNYIILSAESMRYTGQNVAETTISLIQLFKDIQEDGVSFVLGIPFLLLTILGIFTYKKMSNKDKSNCLSFIIIAIISLFMTTSFFPWSVMPNFISTMQFAWRMLAFFEFAMAVIFGHSLYTTITIIAKNKINVFTFIISIILIITMSKVNYNYRYEKYNTLEDNEYEGLIKSQDVLNPYQINREYLPYNTYIHLKTYVLQRTNEVYIINGQTDIEEQNKDKLTFNCIINNVLEGTILEFPFFNYPGYKITLESDGTKQEIDYFESEYGYIAITIPEDMASVKINVEYTGTIIEKVSYIISGIAVIGFIAYILNIKKKC